MKYIKIFEDLSSEYNIGDHVILYKKEAWRIWRIFNVVKIIDKNYYDKKYNNNFKYKVEAIEEDDINNRKIVERHIKSEKMLFIERKATSDEAKQFEDKKMIILGHQQAGISQSVTSKYNL